MLRGGSAFKDLRGAAEKSLNVGGSAFQDLRGVAGTKIP